MKVTRLAGKRFLIGTLSAILAAMLSAAPGGAAQAGGGGINFAWCPDPLPQGDPGCATDTSAQGIVNTAKAAHIPGTIYANSGSYSEDVVANGLQNVTFQGNANFGGPSVLDSLAITNSKNIVVIAFSSSGGISVDKGSGHFIFSGTDGPLAIANSKFDNNPSGSGLSVSHGGSVVLTKVSATKNAGFGIYVSTVGVISAADVSATKNGLMGAYLFSSASVSLATTSAKVNHFDSNSSSGLFVTTSGNAFIQDTSASKNVADGISVSSTGGGMVVVTTSKAKLLHFDKNGGDGVYAATSDEVIIEDVSASSNGGDGLNIPSGPSSISITTYASKSIHFDKNAGYGIEASTAGTLVVIDASASKNGSDGAHLGSGSGITVATTHSNLLHFDGNAGYGLLASSSSHVIIVDVSASKNLASGLFVGSGGYVNVITSHAKTNTFSTNMAYGMNISASGKVILADVTASSNQLDGAHISTGADVQVVLSHGKLNKFDKNNDNGLYVAAGSPSVLVKFSATGNKTYGLYASTSSDAVTVTCSTLKSNTLKDIYASLGTANLILNSVTLTHPGQTDVSFAGSGVMMVASPACP